MAALDVQVTLGDLGPLQAALRARAAALVAKAALDIEAAAKQRAPVDTGALKNSISAVTINGSDYDANVAAAQGLNPEAQIAAAPQPADELEAFVVVPVHYAAYQEFGTVHMPAQPFLTPAIEAVAPSLRAAAEQLSR